ncbi:hypothetical protein B0H66DRAFT_566958 [Apodospora peruviana]|uniref:Uncharacterized protein n=1 Tax=Apodospora peruviana TaxID=516989 RepID=A0AAE0HXG2_9PEZI|nr:hypothetical protein B0H66DRAFT_566958 [Apodospora peruviana]
MLWLNKGLKYQKDDYRQNTQRKQHRVMKFSTHTVVQSILPVPRSLTNQPLEEISVSGLTFLNSCPRSEVFLAAQQQSQESKVIFDIKRVCNLLLRKARTSQPPLPHHSKGQTRHGPRPIWSAGGSKGRIPGNLQEKATARLWNCSFACLRFSRCNMFVRPPHPSCAVDLGERATKAIRGGLTWDNRNLPFRGCRESVFQKTHQSGTYTLANTALQYCMKCRSLVIPYYGGTYRLQQTRILARCFFSTYKGTKVLTTYFRTQCLFLLCCWRGKRQQCSRSLASLGGPASGQAHLRYRGLLFVGESKMD